jgi:hypothetical protein
LPSAQTIVINISMLNVTIFAIAINVFIGDHICGGNAMYYETFKASWYVSHTSYPIQVGKPSIPTLHSSQCERAQAFHIGESAARHALAGMT